jgi:hypothetical protein
MSTNLFNQVETSKAELVTAAQSASLPNDATQTGFEAILGIGNSKSPFQQKPNKKGTQLTVGLLPKSGKGVSLKSVSGLAGKNLDIYKARCEGQISKVLAADFAARVADGSKAVKCVVKDGKRIYTLVESAISVKEVSEDTAMEVMARKLGITVEEVEAKLLA